MRNPDRENLIWLGFNYTGQGLLRKLPLFAAAAVAMLILTSLDGAKTNYEIRQGGDGSSFEINDAFLKTLNPEATAKQEAAVNSAVLTKPESISLDQTLWGWLNEPYRFKYQKFKNGRALLDALAAKAMVVKEDRQFALEKAKNVAEEKKRALERQLAELKGRGDERATIEKQIQDQTNNIELIDTEIGKLEIPLKETTNYVYTKFSDGLPKVLLTVQGRKPGLLDDLLMPILNEQSSLNLVYQAFRLTALIILILSFVFIIVMLFQQSPFSGDTDTVSTQLRTLISMKSGGVAGEIAKTAIISVTALGVGTVVFLGATAPDTPGVSRLLGTPNQSSSTTIRERFRDALLLNPDGQTISDPVAEEYFLQTLFSAQNRNSYFYDFRRYSNGSQSPTIDFNPTILPAPVEVRTVAVPGGDYQALVGELNKLIKKVNSASDLTEIKQQIEALRKELALLNQPNCECQEALSAIGAKIEILNKIIGVEKLTPTPSPSPSTVLTPAKNPTPTPTPTPSSSPSPTTGSGNNPTPTSTPTSTPSILDSLTKTTSALDTIEKELIAMRADNLNKLGASSRNLATRTGELFGSEHYLVSEQVYLALQDLLKGNVKDDALMTALKKMRTQPPLKKGKFLSELRKHMTKDQKQEFQPWERVILNYARLRR